MECSRNGREDKETSTVLGSASYCFWSARGCYAPLASRRQDANRALRMLWVALLLLAVGVLTHTAFPLLLVGVIVLVKALLDVIRH